MNTFERKIDYMMEYSSCYWSQVMLPDFGIYLRWYSRCMVAVESHSESQVLWQLTVPLCNNFSGESDRFVTVDVLRLEAFAI